MLSNKTRDAVAQKFKVNKVSYSDGDNIEDLSEPLVDVMSSVSVLKEEQMKANYRYQNKEIYKYNADSIIINAVPSLNGAYEVRICLFVVVVGKTTPFVEFCLYRDDDGTLRLPTIPVGRNTVQDAQTKLTKVYSEWKADIEYRGFVVSGDEKILVYEWKNNTSDSLDTGTISSRWWRVMSAEIVNHRKMLSFPIRDDVCEFFLENSEFLFLRDENDIVYETPSVGYYGSYYKNIAMTSVFGLRREGPTSSLGPYYYFGSYERAMRYAIWSSSRKPMKIDGKLITIDEKGRYDRGGLVRFALFMGKTKVMMARDSDIDDQSEISQELVSDNSFIKETMKIRDVDANWVFDFNSVRHGKYKIQTEGRESSVLLPKIVVKDYNQQSPLSYYYVNTDQEPETAVIE
jgi:hypothetical protein